MLLAKAAPEGAAEALRIWNGPSYLLTFDPQIIEGSPVIQVRLNPLGSCAASPSLI